MTKKQRELREKAVCAKFIDENPIACVEAQMALVNRMKHRFFYRYRPLKSYEVDSLENETIFLRWPSTYEDEGDCTPVLDFEEVTNFIIRKNFPGFDTDALRHRFIKYEEIIDNPKMMKKINEMRDMWFVSCFTEDYDNLSMWEKYADQGRGICLAYEATSLLEEVKKYRDLYAQFLPVRYVDDRNSCRDMMLNHHDLLEDLSGTTNKLLLVCMTKNRIKYSKEEEWRLLMYGERKERLDIGMCAPFINPNIIFCGPDIDTHCDDYQRLIVVAKKKNIDVVHAEKG